MDIELIARAVLVAISARAFLEYMTAPGMIFEKYGEWLQELSYKGHERLAKVLGHCYLCFTGQLALWWYLLEFRAVLNVADGICFICLAMTSAQILYKIIPE